MPWTVAAGAPDPVVNHVEAHYHPVGFPNDITATGSHSLNLFQPSITFDKTGDTLSKIGDDVSYTLTLNNTSSADSPSLVCTVSDPLIGVDQQVTLASGGQSVIQKTYTVPAGASDPLPNSASVSCSPQGFPNVLTASDDHSVNLFQPAIELTKTGDDLSKIGDTVNYAITLYNNSSADTPNLDCTVTDPVAGVNATFSVASGANHVINVNFTIPANGADPFLNTANATCSPSGFPNVYNDSATWSTNLFQPSIKLTKTGPAYSKVGDTSSYHVKIENTSSADTPAMNLVSFTDSKVANVTLPVECSTLATGASCEFDYTYTVQAGDDSGQTGAQLSNTATAIYSPSGFPNQIPGSSTWTLTLLHPNFTVSKACSAQPVSQAGPAVFTVTFNNTGDADLNISADDGIGSFSLAKGASRTFTVSVPGPFTATVNNSVTASATLAQVYNLSNVIGPKSADASCTVFGKAKVVKTVSGAPPSGTQEFTFQLRQGATTIANGTTLATEVAKASNGGNLTFATNLTPGQTYQLCEIVMPGWLTSLGTFVPGSFNPPDGTVANPAVDNSILCVNFTVASGETKTFTVENTPPPGGRALTIGFWKNWASCASSGGKQKPVLDQTLAKAEPIGIVVSATSGTYAPFGGTIYLVLHGSTATPDIAIDCLKAVRLLDKSTIDTNKKMASDPAFNLAAQLVAAELNYSAGAGKTPATTTAINQAVVLLGKYKFDGKTHTTISKADAATMNSLATTLDNYNNNRP
jgi:hypothetical protein